MSGYHFTKYIPPANTSANFDSLMKLLSELLVITSGNVSESLAWLTQLDEKYKLTSPTYGIGDFIEDLKAKGYLTEDPGSGKFKITGKSEQFIRKQALEEIFGKLKKSGKGATRWLVGLVTSDRPSRVLPG